MRWAAPASIAATSGALCFGGSFDGGATASAAVGASAGGSAASGARATGRPDSEVGWLAGSVCGGGLDSEFDAEPGDELCSKLAIMPGATQPSR